MDNSVTARSGLEQVRAALDALNEQGDAIASCLPQVLEEGFSARNADEHKTIVEWNSTAKEFLAPNSRVAEEAMRIQTALFATGMGRAAGVSDIQIAATALAYSGDTQTVTVVHYDHDFDLIAQVVPELHTRWIVSRGSAG
ncbi:MAG: hypothetical protein LBR20_06705 [Propionibacteriaceae bacterium]|nr:hypothetical protein [Propionibacteriaceae bacterium]